MKQAFSPLARSIVHTLLLGTLLSGLLLPLPAQGAGADTLRILRLSPADGTVEVPRSMPVVVFFDRPVVALSAIEQPGAAPARLEPPVPGQGRWLNTSTWAWYPAHALAGATRYVVTVPAGLRAVDGTSLPATVSLSFATVRPAVARVHPADREQYADFRAPITVRFNQNADHASAEAAFSLRDQQGRRISGTFSWPRPDTMLFHPLHWLTPGDSFSAEVGAGMRSAEGPLGPTGPTTWQFTTAAIPRVTGSTPSNGERSGDLSQGLKLFFNAPVDPRLISKHLRLIPHPAGMSVNVAYDDPTEIDIGGTWLPSTHYRLALDGVVGTYGQAMAGTWRMGFVSAPLPASVAINRANVMETFDAYRPVDVALRAVNTRGVFVSLYPLSRQEFIGLFSDNDILHYQPSERPLYTRERRTAGPLNTSVVIGQELGGPRGGLLPPGFYFLTVSGSDGGDPDILAFMVTRSSVTLKNSAGRTLVWVTDLHSGQPVPGVPVRVLTQSEGRLVAAGHTGADGVLDVPSGTVTAQNNNLLALVDRPGDAALASSYWGNGVQSGDFNLPYGYSTNGHQGYLYTDRPIYRPGQPVHFRGLLRRDDDGAYSLLPHTPVRVTINDANNRFIYSRSMFPDAFGSLSGDVPLAPSASLGWYSVNIQAGNDYFSVPFQVADYRKPEYTVGVSPARPGGNYTTGERVRVSVAARYLFDAPVNRARVHWSVVSNDLYFSSPAFPDYTFQDYPILPLIYSYSPLQNGRPDGYPAPANGYGGPFGAYGCMYGCNRANVVLQGDTRTNADGTLTLSLPADLRTYALSQQWSVEADVTDQANNPVSGRVTLSVHKALFYIGLRGPSTFAVAGRPAHIDLVTVEQDGTTRVPRVSVAVTLYRRTYRTVFTPGYAWPQLVPVDRPVARYHTVTGTDARARLAIMAPSSGEFRVVATSSDARGNPVRSAISLYVAGQDEAASPWFNAPQDRMPLVPDRHLYHIGDVARVLVAAPRRDMTALVTIERGRVHSHQVLRLSGSSPILRIPILPGYLPDVFVSVVAVSGTGPGADTPLWKMGAVELPVDVRARRLTLTLRSSVTRAHPGQRLTLHLHAADPAGHPVRGEFSLAVVDKAVLLLAGEQSAPILDGFYAERGLGVQTSYSQNVAGYQLPASALSLTPAARERHAMSQAAIPAQKGGGGGGGGGGVQPAPRAYFPDTAYWRASVTTDGHGDTTVELTLPDSLTTWTVSARGLTADTMVGQTSIEVVSTRDLLLRPLLPRFLSLGDRAEVGAVVNNTTARAVTARVTLGVSGVATAEHGYQPRYVRVPAGDARAVTWPLHPAGLGTARFLIGVSAPGTGGDSLLLTSPVQPNSTPEVVATSGHVGASRTERVAVPVGAQPGEGGLTLTLQPSLAAGLRSGVDYLQQYPWESNVDLAARLMGETALLRLPASATGLSAATPAAYRRDIAVTIGKLAMGQRGDGGWGWWLGDTASSPAVSALCADALGVARQAGYRVDGNMLTHALSYLSAQLTAPAALAVPGPTDVAPDLSAYIAYVLDANGARGNAMGLYAGRDQMPLWSRAYLLRALRLENNGRLDAPARTILAELEAGAHLDAAGAHWEGLDGDVSMSDPIVATAVVLDALLEADPGSPLIAPATRWLVVARHGEVWPTTVDNAMALRTLSDQLRSTGELRGRYRYAVTLRGSTWGSGAVEPATIAQPHVLTSGPIGSGLAPGATAPVRITRSNSSGRLYYTLRMAYYPRVDRVGALSRGLSITRRYLYRGREVQSAPLGAVVRVQLTVSSPQDLYYLDIEDPLPAGAEAVDPSLLTTSQLHSGGYTVPKTVADLAWYASHTELRDDRTAIFCPYLPAGVYRYEYEIHLAVRGVFHALPVHAAESYFPEVFGRTAGGYFTVR